MKKLSSQEIRMTWLNFFKERGHAIEKGASLIPDNDPTLLWINAGVAALKKYFDGSQIPESKRITNVQKCIRTNDITNVGKTARHHTFFEMLGNFSIGDYFRKEVIPWAFEILTCDKYFGLDKEKIYVTYHPDDNETRELWIKQGLDASHLIPLEGNFWQIGEGPCGPNTEVFFDRGEKYDPENLGIKMLEDDIENDRYIEIWGIVFSQYNAVNGVKREDYKELPHKNIDTGAGLERIACVLQETETNFETDLFFPIILDLQEVCNKPYEGKYLMPYRVIADHIRACSFALADGEHFSNEGRGYVLRRLLRRAMRYGQKLGLYEPFMYRLVPSVIKVMKDFYPYIIEKEEYLEKVIKNEETKFLKTLKTGEALLAKILENTDHLSGQDAFKLYDTYGFPIELTLEICGDNNIPVDVDGFNELLQKQRDLARNSRKNIESFNKQSLDLLEFKEKSEFTYSSSSIEGKVIGLFKDGVKVDSIEDEGEVVFDRTNFYAEMGGQVADTGFIKNDDFMANVTYVGKCPNGQHLHKIKVNYGEIKLGDKVDLVVDEIRHHKIEMNHSATHLLQSALINVLGDGIHQRGSYVDENVLRFDFSYDHKVNEEDLMKIENLVNEYITQSIPCKVLNLPIEEAKKVGALAEFDGKYGDVVRVVTFGEVSKEFCGGTHVKNSNEIGVFTIQTETAIASGVRRIFAYTGYNSFKLYRERILLLNIIKEKLEALSFSELDNRLTALLKESSNDKKEIVSLNKKISHYQSQSIKNEIASNKFAISYLPNTTKTTLNMINDEVNNDFKDFVLVLVGEENGRHPIIVSCGKDTVASGIKAKDIIKKVLSVLGGNGGGKETLAQGNALSVDKISEIKKDSING